MKATWKPKHEKKSRDVNECKFGTKKMKFAKPKKQRDHISIAFFFIGRDFCYELHSLKLSPWVSGASLPTVYQVSAAFAICWFSKGVGRYCFSAATFSGTKSKKLILQLNNLVIQSDLFGMVKWPFQGVKVTSN